MGIVFKKRLKLRYAHEHDAAMLLTLVNQSNFIKYIGDKAISNLVVPKTILSSRLQHLTNARFLALMILLIFKSCLVYSSHQT